MAGSLNRNELIRRADREGVTARTADDPAAVTVSWEALDAVLDQLDALRRRSQGFQIGDGNIQHNVF